MLFTITHKEEHVNYTPLRCLIKTDKTERANRKVIIIIIMVLEWLSCHSQKRTVKGILLLHRNIYEHTWTLQARRLKMKLVTSWRVENGVKGTWSLLLQKKWLPADHYLVVVTLRERKRLSKETNLEESGCGEIYTQEAKWDGKLRLNLETYLQI